MTTIAYEKISENRFGELFKVSIIHKDQMKPIEVFLKNVKTIFGKEDIYNKSYIKWCISNNDSDVVLLLEKILRDSCDNDKIEEFVSQVITRPNYPKMLKTKLANTCSHDIIKHSKGKITTFNEIKNKLCNVTLLLKFVNINKRKLTYNFEIKEIALLEDN
tara:strand:- start:205 stop:687 length:483 start_codon:yes stop_codon:yes gene_type:complete